MDNAKNIIALTAVALAVAGAVWWKSTRQDTPAATPASLPQINVQPTPHPEAQEQHAPEQETPKPRPTTAPTPQVSPSPVPPEPSADDRSTSDAIPLMQTPTPQPTAKSVETPQPAPQASPQPAALPRLVDLGSDKCKQCKALAPILDELRTQYVGRLSVEFIDVWKKPKEAQLYKIRLIPTQILYDGTGKELWRHEGFISKKELIDLFADKVGVK